MATHQLLIICGTVLALAGLVAAVLVHYARLVEHRRRIELERAFRAAEKVERDDRPPARIGHRVTVHTKKPDDQTIFGVLVGDYADRISLEDAEYVTAAGAHAMPGRQDIATRDVAWIDVHANVVVPPAAPVPAAVEG
jgi:hypothetical protein